MITRRLAMVSRFIVEEDNFSKFFIFGYSKIGESIVYKFVIFKKISVHHVGVDIVTSEYEKCVLDSA